MPTRSNITQKIVTATQCLRRELSQQDFSQSVPWIYNPLEYAWKAHKQYLTQYARGSCQILFLGMNPGPWGMAQTGIPFGEIAAVTEFLNIRTLVSKPSPEHPKRPIDGFQCRRSEVSGRRLWGLFKDKFSTADAFFEEHFVGNYCPLVFMEASARNITPDKLPAALRGPLESICDRHLAQLIELLAPRWVIGIGAFAENCAKRAIGRTGAVDFQIGRILHPSPASPAANRDWAGTATRQLEELGVW